MARKELLSDWSAADDLLGPGVNEVDVGNECSAKIASRKEQKGMASFAA